MPVIFLSAKGDIVDKGVGFAAGGDDYMVKPFDPPRADDAHRGASAPRRHAPEQRCAFLRHHHRGMSFLRYGPAPRPPLAGEHVR